MGLVLKFTTSFSFSIYTNKRNLFIWKSLPKIGAYSEHREPNMTEVEECTSEYSLPLLLFNYILRTISNLEKKCMVGQDSVFRFFVLYMCIHMHFGTYT